MLLEQGSMELVNVHLERVNTQDTFQPHCMRFVLAGGFRGNAGQVVHADGLGCARRLVTVLASKHMHA